MNGLKLRLHKQINKTFERVSARTGFNPDKMPRQVSAAGIVEYTGGPGEKKLFQFDKATLILSSNVDKNEAVLNFYFNDEEVFRDNVRFVFGLLILNIFRFGIGQSLFCLMMMERFHVSLLHKMIYLL
jgi:hypothetical protein